MQHLFSVHREAKTTTESKAMTENVHTEQVFFSQCNVSVSVFERVVLLNLVVDRAGHVFPCILGISSRIITKFVQKMLCLNRILKAHSEHFSWRYHAVQLCGFCLYTIVVTLFVAGF